VGTHHDRRAARESLTQIVLVLLSVMFLREMLMLGEALTFQALVVPAGVALLAASLRLLEWTRH
jgi:hypothetical protein